MKSQRIFNGYYIWIFSDVAVWIYYKVTKLVEEEVQPLIVPAVIEHQELYSDPSGGSQAPANPIVPTIHNDGVYIGMISHKKSLITIFGHKHKI